SCRATSAQSALQEAPAPARIEQCEATQMLRFTPEPESLGHGRLERPGPPRPGVPMFHFHYEMVLRPRKASGIHTSTRVYSGAVASATVLRRTEGDESRPGNVSGSHAPPIKQICRGGRGCMASHLQPEQQMTVASLPPTGSLQREWRRCGKPTCRCASGMLHGPYWYLRWRD